MFNTLEDYYSILLISRALVGIFLRATGFGRLVLGGKLYNNGGGNVGATVFTGTSMQKAHHRRQPEFAEICPLTM